MFIAKLLVHGRAFNCHRWESSNTRNLPRSTVHPTNDISVDESHECRNCKWPVQVNRCTYTAALPLGRMDCMTRRRWGIVTRSAHRWRSTCWSVSWRSWRRTYSCTRPSRSAIDSLVSHSMTSASDRDRR